MSKEHGTRCSFVTGNVVILTIDYFISNTLILLVFFLGSDSQSPDSGK